MFVTSSPPQLLCSVVCLSCFSPAPGNRGLLPWKRQQQMECNTYAGSVSDAVSHTVAAEYQYKLYWISLMTSHLTAPPPVLGVFADLSCQPV